MDLHLLYKAIRDYFDETPVEEWAYLHFLKSFEPVIMSTIDTAKDTDKGTWRKRFVTRLEKIANDDAYSEQQRNTAIRLKGKNLLCVGNFWDEIEGKKMNLRKKREVVNMTNSVINNIEIDALEFIETARTEKKKMILSSLKRKPENVVNAGKRRKMHSGKNSEYNESDDPEESDEEVIDITQDEEARNLAEDEVHIRNKLLDVLAANKDRDKQSGKNFMSSVPLNNIIDIADRETYKAIKSILNDDQLEWFKGVIQNGTWDQTDEFKHYINQFTEDKCNRVHIPTLVRKTYISGRFDSSFHEAHDIAQHIMIHCSVRLEAPVTRESDFFHLERTYSVDTVVYILNRLFRMHNDVLDGGWIELTTPDTKSHKIDGIFKAIKTKRENKALIIIECSKGPKTPEQKKYDDHVKLCRNSMRLLNKVLENVPKNYARIYLVQCAGGYIDIKYLVRPLPSVYLLNRFLRIKIPKTFNDFEDFSKGIIDLMNWQTDVLLTVKKINKACETKNDEIHITPIQDTPQKDKTKRKTKKVTNDNDDNDDFPPSPCPGSVVNRRENSALEDQL